MSPNDKNGKRPVSQKTEMSPVKEDGFEFGNKLALSATLKAEAAEKGYELRYISAKKFYENQGYHENGWVPYRIEKGSHGTIEGFKFGNDPEGVVRRGDAILACRKIETGEKHRAFLRNKASRYSQGKRKQNQESLSEAMSRAGLGKAIIDEESDE